jgi:hypothetical protein
VIVDVQTSKNNGLDLVFALLQAWYGSMISMSTEPTQPDFARLYRQAFKEYGARALWNKRMLEEPTREDALVVARALRVEGNRAARQLAEQIERACRATV